MDQDEFRRTYREVNEIGCVFEKSVLTNQCECRRAERFCIAEREGVHCADESGQARCHEWLTRLREQARFALRSDLPQTRLAHGKAIKLQVGGLIGLATLIGERDTSDKATSDVDALLETAQQRYGDLGAVPFSAIMPAVAAFTPRRRSRRQR